MVDYIKKTCVSVLGLLWVFSCAKGILPIELIGSYRGELSTIQQTYQDDTEFGTCIKVRQAFDALMNNSVDISVFVSNLSNVLDGCHFESAVHEAINLLFHYLIFYRPFNFEKACENVDFICLIEPLRNFLDKSLDDIGFHVVSRDYLNTLRPCQKFFLRGFAELDLERIIQMCLQEKRLPFLASVCLKKIVIWIALNMACDDCRQLIFSFTQFRLFFSGGYRFFPSFYTFDNGEARELFFSDGVWEAIPLNLQDIVQCIFDDDIVRFNALITFYGVELCDNFDYIELAALAGSVKIFNALFASCHVCQHKKLVSFAIQGGCLSIIQQTIAQVAMRDLHREFVQAIRWHRHAIADWLLAYAKVSCFEYAVPFSASNFYVFNNLAFFLMMSKKYPIPWNSFSFRRYNIFDLALSYEWSALSAFCRLHCDPILFKQDIGYLWLANAAKTGIPYFAQELLKAGVDVSILRDKNHKRFRRFRVNPYFLGTITCLAEYGYQLPSVSIDSSGLS